MNARTRAAASQVHHGHSGPQSARHGLVKPLLLHGIAALALSLTATGCFVSRDLFNESLRKKPFDQLVPGTTTAAQVTELFGAPNEVIQLGTRSAYRYDSTVVKNAGFSIIVVTFINADSRSDRVWMFFDSKDVLTHYGKTLDARDTEHAMPWQELGGH